jgi:hypothetical protein
LNGDGSFAYTPNYDFVGSDTFTYKANDGVSDSNIATITIEIYEEGIADVIFEIMPKPFNRKSKGVLPAAIFGSDDLDITKIDPSTIKLTRYGEQHISILRYSYDDMGTPNIDDCECKNHIDDLDGIMDIGFKFKRQEINILLTDDDVGEIVTLMVTGNYKEEFGGNQFQGYDCILVIK